MIVRTEYAGRIYTRNPESKKANRRIYFTRKKESNGKRKTVYLHRVIWEAAHGPIPLGCVIHHKDGNPLNNNLENLQCIPEYLHQRTFHRDVRKRTLIPVFCSGCGQKFMAKTKRSRCPSCGGGIA